MKYLFVIKTSKFCCQLINFFVETDFSRYLIMPFVIKRVRVYDETMKMETN